MTAPTNLVETGRSSREALAVSAPPDRLSFLLQQKVTGVVIILAAVAPSLSGRRSETPHASKITPTPLRTGRGCDSSMINSRSWLIVGLNLVPNFHPRAWLAREAPLMGEYSEIPVGPCTGGTWKLPCCFFSFSPFTTASVESVPQLSAMRYAYPTDASLDRWLNGAAQQSTHAHNFNIELRSEPQKSRDVDHFEKHLSRSSGVA